MIKLDSLAHVSGTLPNASQDGVNQFLKQVGSRRRGPKKQDGYTFNCDSAVKVSFS